MITGVLGSDSTDAEEENRVINQPVASMATQSLLTQTVRKGLLNEKEVISLTRPFFTVCVRRGWCATPTSEQDYR